MSKPRKIAEGKAELQRSLNSAAQLDKKADEYRQRLAHLQVRLVGMPGSSDEPDPCIFCSKRSLHN